MPVRQQQPRFGLSSSRFGRWQSSERAGCLSSGRIRRRRTSDWSPPPNAASLHGSGPAATQARSPTHSQPSTAARLVAHNRDRNRHRGCDATNQTQLKPTAPDDTGKRTKAIATDSCGRRGRKALRRARRECGQPRESDRPGADERLHFNSSCHALPSYCSSCTDGNDADARAFGASAR